MTTRPGGLYNRPQSTRPIDAPAALLGRTLDARFRLDSVVSVGGMGIIFAATQVSVGRKVTVKILKPTLADEADLSLRFQQEIELVAALSHPNIVSLIDAGRDSSGLNYLAMEFVEGETFREALKHARLSLSDILQIVILTCDALIEAHALEIIHRDLKFDNIMLSRHRDRRLHVKVLDFGVAKILSRDANLTRGGQIPGTPSIIAPEIVEDRGPSARSDLYSVGILLYTALTGAPPFQGANDLELMRAHLFEPVPPMQEAVQAYVPEALIELTYALLQKKPEHRPGSAQELRNQLETIRAALLAAHPDLAAYVPPSLQARHDDLGSGAYRSHGPRGTLPDLVHEADQSQRLQRDFLDGIEETDQQEEQKPFLVVPASIVSVLVLLLMVLLFVIIMLVREIVIPR